jgi:CheY-like chemotaxis protein
MSLEDARRLEHILAFFMHPDTIKFTIASEPELDAVLLATEKGEVPETKEAGTSRAGAPRPRLKLSGLTKSASAGVTGSRSSASFYAQKLTAISPERFMEYASGLLTAVSLLVRTRVGEDEEKIRKIRTRVHYCELIASRTNLGIIQTDRLILSAWLSALREDKRIIDELCGTLKLDELLFYEKIPPENRSEESLILSLVECYQKLQEEEQSIVSNINMIRSALRAKWSSCTQHEVFIETFLQLLMDEQFLERTEVMRGKVLFADQAEALMSTMAVSLETHGYEVNVVASVDQAREKIRAWLPDVIIVTSNLNGGGGLKLCHALKGEQSTSHIPVLVLLAHGDENKDVDFLRAGAEDCFKKPVALEVLMLKIEKLLGKYHGVEAKEGVSGSLSDMSFSDMIQILCSGNKSVEVNLVNGSKRGSVFIKNGEIIHAETGELKGESAFYEMVSWNSGMFTTKRLATVPERTIFASAMSLLMEGARLHDEGSESEGTAQ